MNKDVLIKVKGMQGALSGDETIEMVTIGQYFEKNGKTYVKYDDTSLDEQQVTATTLKIEPHQVTILRHGATNTQMIFEQDKEHYTPYETPFGLFELIVRTTSIDLDVEEGLISLIVDYTMDINHTGAVASQFVVEVTNQS